MVFLPGTVFVKPPSSSLPLQPGRPWIFANFADIAKYEVNFPPYIVQTEYVNPALTLAELAWGTPRPPRYGTVTSTGSRPPLPGHGRPRPGPGPRHRPGGRRLRPDHHTEIAARAGTPSRTGLDPHRRLGRTERAA